MSIITGLFLTAIAVIAVILTLSGTLGLGEFITVVGLAQFLLDPLEALALHTGAWWASATASAARVLNLLRDAEPLAAVTDESPSPVDVPDAQPGEFVVISCNGTQAAGVLAALRVRHPEALYAPHAAHLFTGSVTDNVRPSDRNADTVAAALHAAACEELATALPAGLASGVGENGAALSGGQRQRVALARALAHDPELLVLHDPTTAVDAVTESRIAERVHEARRDRRTIVVTRAPAFAAVADRVIRITDKGRA